MELQIGSYFLPELWKHCLLFSSFQICCREVCFLLIFSSLNMASMCSLKTFRIFPLSSVLCYFQFRDVCLKYFYDNFLPSILSSLFPEPLLLDVGLLDWFSNFLVFFFSPLFFFFILPSKTVPELCLLALVLNFISDLVFWVSKNFFIFSDCRCFNSILFFLHGVSFISLRYKLTVVFWYLSFKFSFSSCTVSIFPSSFFIYSISSFSVRSIIGYLLGLCNLFYI